MSGIEETGDTVNVVFNKTDTNYVFIGGGEGNIGKDKDAVFISLQQGRTSKKLEVGDDVRVGEDDVEMTGLRFCLWFSQPQTIDLIIDRLNKAKERLNRVMETKKA